MTIIKKYIKGLNNNRMDSLVKEMAVISKCSVKRQIQLSNTVFDKPGLTKSEVMKKIRYTLLQVSLAFPYYTGTQKRRECIRV